MNVLEHKLASLELELENEDGLFQDIQDQITRVKNEIKEIVAQKAKGAIMHSRVNYELNSNKPTKYFLNLEKRNFQNKTIYHI